MGSSLTSLIMMLELVVLFLVMGVLNILIIRGEDEVRLKKIALE